MLAYSLRRVWGTFNVKPVLVASLLLVLLLPDLSYARDYSLYSHDIGCREIALGRSRQICEAVAASLTWQWMGHAIIAPGYKPTFQGVREVYCELKISRGDVTTLQRLKTYDPVRKWQPDWRLETGAEMLLRIVLNLEGDVDPETSIFNPKNPNYILKDGCS